MPVPRLASAQTGPVLWLEKILDGMPKIKQWLRGQWQEHAAVFYGSVNLQLAPVDTNLFPGGFNNLNKEFLPLWLEAAMAAIELEHRETAHERQCFPQVRTANN